MLNEKILLHQFLVEKITTDIHLLETNINSIKESKSNSTKSSVGDKYETETALLQIEEAQLQNQLQQKIEQLNILNRIDYNKSNTIVIDGSLIHTNIGKFYISIGIGKLKFNDEQYFIISSKSPLGLLLYNRKIGDIFEFNKQTINIINTL
ncbi:MAG: hypothetical protein H6553_05955 [Chitinophagales bacterium]|nr:hypothetical protein [Chitinophagales bacterium]